jgi:hypothetical protein
MVALTEENEMTERTKIVVALCALGLFMFAPVGVVAAVVGGAAVVGAWLLLQIGLTL